MRGLVVAHVVFSPRWLVRFYAVNWATKHVTARPGSAGRGFSGFLLACDLFPGHGFLFAGLLLAHFLLTDLPCGSLFLADLLFTDLSLGGSLFRRLLLADLFPGHGFLLADLFLGHRFPSHFFLGYFLLAGFFREDLLSRSRRFLLLLACSLFCGHVELLPDREKGGIIHGWRLHGSLFFSAFFDARASR